MKLKISILLTLLLAVNFSIRAQNPGDSLIISINETEANELVEKIMNMPNIEVGKGVTFQPKNKSFEMTIRFRMQNMAGITLDKDFSIQETEARVKRLRLRFDGYIYSPKLTYSIQLGFTPYDSKSLPNGNVNFVRDAMIYYVPSSTWNIGFGQTKIKANRARTNSSSALQFVDRSIVNSQFNLDRDFGVFGEFNKRLFSDFNIAAKGAITLGEGRNWSSSSGSGLAYTGRLELFPLGRFKANGDIIEGDYEREETVKILLAGAYSYNNRALRIQGQNGDWIPSGETRNLSSYFLDFILKYRGFAFYTDFMGRTTGNPLFGSNETSFIYTGKGINVQTSYIFPSNWEIALRNSTMLPDSEVQDFAGYKNLNQTTFGVTKYLKGHSLKIQADASYNHQKEAANPDYNRWQFRFQIELGL